MRSLFKYDLLRLLKDKLFLVGVIISFSLAVVIPLILFLIGNQLRVEQLNNYNDLIKDAEFLAEYPTFEDYYTPFVGISLPVSLMLWYMPVGFILLLFMSIIVNKDINQGTIRNKLIIGKSRTEIYFSNLFALLIVYLGLIIAATLVTLVVSFVLFYAFLHVGWASEIHAGYLVAYLVINLLSWASIATVINLFSYALDKPVFAILLPMLVGIFIGSLVPTIIQMIIGLTSKDAESAHNAFDIYYYFEALDYFQNMFGNTIAESYSGSYDTILYKIYNEGYTMLGSTGEKFGIGSFILRFLSPIIFGGLHVFLGWIGIKNRDFK